VVAGAPTSFARRAAKRVLALCVACGVALVLIAVTLWVWRPFSIDPPLYPGDCEVTTRPSPHSVIDPALGWRFAPDAVIDDPSPDFHVVYRCNSAGFRAVVPRDERADARRIVFVGDSFVFGVGVDEEQTFVERVAAARDDLRVINLGMPGYGVDQMRCALVELGLREHPDLVVAVFNVDDMARSMTAFRFRDGWTAKPTFTLDRGTLVPLSVDNRPNALRRWFANTFYVAEFWRRAENKLGLERGFGARFELNRALFVAMHEDVKSIGANLLVVHLPQRGAWRPVSAFEDGLRARGVRFLDLGAMQVDDPSRLFFAHDPHINADGHRFVAEALLHAFDEAGGVLGSRKR
jgi:hypothetical protein